MPGEEDPARLMHCQVEINGGALMLTDMRAPDKPPRDAAGLPPPARRRRRRPLVEPRRRGRLHRRRPVREDVLGRPLGHARRSLRPDVGDRRARRPSRNAARLTSVHDQRNPPGFRTALKPGELAASISARSRRMRRRRAACWRRSSGRVRWRARFLAAVRARRREVRASWSSWSPAWKAGFGACGRGSTIAAMRAMSLASTRSVLARVPMASAKRRTRAGLSLARGTPAR